MILKRTKLFALNQVDRSIIKTSKKIIGQKPVQSPKQPKTTPQMSMQLAKMKQQNETMRHQRATQKLQLEKQKMGLRGQLATQKRLQEIKDNQIRIKRLEMANNNRTQMNLFKAKPKDSSPVIVSM